jgi:PKD repeat protein
VFNKLGVVLFSIAIVILPSVADGETCDPATEVRNPVRPIEPEYTVVDAGPFFSKQYFTGTSNACNGAATGVALCNASSNSTSCNETSDFGNCTFWKLHLGQDLNYACRPDSSDCSCFDCDCNKPLYSIAAGVVFDRGFNHASFGNWVLIKHENDARVFYSFYAHLNQIENSVTVDSCVTPETKIGLIGNTGLATSCHVHLEIRNGLVSENTGNGYQHHYCYDKLSAYVDPQYFIDHFDDNNPKPSAATNPNPVNGSTIVSWGGCTDDRGTSNTDDDVGGPCLQWKRPAGTDFEEVYFNSETQVSRNWLTFGEPKTGCWMLDELNYCVGPGEHSWKVVPNNYWGPSTSVPEWTFTIPHIPSLQGCTPTLSAQLTASPNQGTSPLSGVDLRASVSGTASGPITYTFYCDRPDSGTDIRPGHAARFVNTQLNPQIAVDACSYPNVGTYTPKVIVERGNQVDEDRTTVTVSQSTGTCWPLTLQRNNASGGSLPLVPDPNSPGCPTGRYRSGSEFLTTVVPNSGWRVKNWNGTTHNSSAAITNTVVMPNSAHTVQVNYEQGNPVCYDLNREHSGEGDNPDATPNKSTGCSTGDYVAGELIIVEADPDSGWAVQRWDGTINDASTSTRNSVIMPDRDHDVEVFYRDLIVDQHELEIEVVGTGQGRVEASPGTISCSNYSGGGTNCDETYDEDTRVELIPIPRPGSEFTSWGGDNDCANGILTMEGPRDCRARFNTQSSPCKSLALWSFGEGTAPVASPTNSPGCPSGYYTVGTNISLSGANAAPGWRVVSWESTDNDSSMSSTNSLTMPHEETVTVNYGRLDGRPTVETYEEVVVQGLTARIEFAVNPNGFPVTYNIVYGTTPGFGYESWSGSLPARFVTDYPNRTLTDLACGTTYFASAVAENSQGRVYGGTVSFTTSACPISAPTAVTEPADHVLETSLRLRGTVNARGLPTEVWFEWGRTASLGNVTTRQFVGSLSGDVNLVQPLSGLECNSAYYFRVAAQNGQGSAVGSIVQQSTAPCTITADFSATPVVGTVPLSVSFSDLSAGQPTAWLWTFGDGTSSTLKNPIHVFKSPGVYTVRLRTAKEALSSVKFRTGLVHVKAPIEVGLPAFINISQGASNLPQGIGQIIGPEIWEDFGSSIALGDISEQGKAGIAVGAPYADPVERINAGKTYLVPAAELPGHREVVDLSRVPHTEVLGADDDDYFAKAIAIGDLNGDDIPDFVGGAYLADLGQSLGRGKVSILYGTSAIDEVESIDLRFGPPNGLQMTSVLGHDSNESFGESLAIGDLNGDGLEDLAIGVPSASSASGLMATEGLLSAGELFILYGNRALSSANQLNLGTPGGTGLFKRTWIGGESAFGRLGHDSAVGDVNGDGIKDIVVAAPGASPLDRETAGTVYVLYGSESWADMDTHFIGTDSPVFKTTRLHGPMQHGAAGTRVAAGDLNGDGFDDIVISPVMGVGDTVAWVVHGSADIANRPSIQLVTFGDSASLNIAFSTSLLNSSDMIIEDVTGDGFGDLIMGKTSHPEYVSRILIVDGPSIVPGSRIYIEGPFGFHSPYIQAADYPYGFGQSLGVLDSDNNGILEIAIGANVLVPPSSAAGTRGSVFILHPDKLAATGFIFYDGFESGNTMRWSQSIP